MYATLQLKRIGDRGRDASTSLVCACACACTAPQGEGGLAIFTGDARKVILRYGPMK